MNDEIKTRVSQLSGSVDRPETALDHHISMMESTLGGLERALLQYENLLSRLRGGIGAEVAVVSSEKPTNRLAILEQLDARTGDISSSLNNAADELNGLL